MFFPCLLCVRKSNIYISLLYVSLAIEDDYLGPKLEADKVTLDFMKQLMECYKNQGKLHRKYAYKVGFVILTVLCLLQTLSNFPDFAGGEEVVHDAALDGGCCHSR